MVSMAAMGEDHVLPIGFGLPPESLERVLHGSVRVVGALHTTMYPCIQPILCNGIIPGGPRGSLARAFPF